MTDLCVRCRRYMPVVGTYCQDCNDAVAESYRMLAEALAERVFWFDNTHNGGLRGWVT